MKSTGRKHYKKGTVFVGRYHLNVSEIEQKLKKHPRVCITRFGCFEKREIKARRFRHPNGKMVRSPAYVKVRFVPSLPFKKSINK